MELRQLITFRTLAETLSFTVTASVLNYAQSSITTQIQTLEAELGVALFDRLGKKIKLTDAGRRFMPYADRILSLADEAQETLVNHADLTGTLTVSASETLCTYRLPPLLKAFKTRYPGVALHFKPTTVAQLRPGVLSGALDVAFALEPPIHSSAIQAETLFDEPLYLVAAPGHPLDVLKTVYPGDLEAESLLYTEQGCHYRNAFEQTLLENGIYPGTHFEFLSIEAIKQCVIIGLGISILPAITVASEIADGRLIRLNWFQSDFHIPTRMMIHKDKWLSPTLTAFLDMARVLIRPLESNTETMLTDALA